jgi:hypothetical protein
VKRNTLYSTTIIGANTTFLQIDRCCTPFSALHQFFPTLPIIWDQVEAKRFCKIQDGGPLNFKKNAQRRMLSAPTLEQALSIVTNFDPP